MAVCLLFFASAVYEGQILTQSQINNYDTNITFQEAIEDLDCQLISAGEKVFHEHRYYYVKSFSCLSIAPKEDSYLVIRDTYYIGFPISRFKDCVELFGIDKCKTAFNRDLKKRAKENILGIIEKIKGYQDVTDDADVTGLDGAIW